MGLEHLAAVLEHAKQGGSHLVLLMVIASYSDQRGEWIIDQATLQKRSRLRRRRVQQLLDELVQEGELAVISHHGRGKLSTYRLLVGPPNPFPLLPVEGSAMGEGGQGGEGPKNVQPAAPFSEESAAQKGAAECTFSEGKGAVGCTFSAQKGAAECTFSDPPVPPFPPDPQIPPYPPKAKTKKQETFGLRPLTEPQSAVSRVNLLLEEAGIPRPSPAQIGLWSKTAGGIESLLALLSRLIQAGLANKREPLGYIHRVVIEQAVRPEPARPLDARAGRDLLRAAGADEIRWQQALEIINTTEES